MISQQLDRRSCFGARCESAGLSQSGVLVDAGQALGSWPYRNPTQTPPRHSFSARFRGLLETSSPSARWAWTTVMSMARASCEALPVARGLEWRDGVTEPRQIEPGRTAEGRSRLRLAPAGNLRASSCSPSSTGDAARLRRSSARLSAPTRCIEDCAAYAQSPS
jgi:hypothetical protein